MTGEERSTVTSNDYADFIINYRSNPKATENIPNATVFILDETYAIIHVPISSISGVNIPKMPFAFPPNLYGLVSKVSLEASGVEQLRNIPAFDLRGDGVLIGILDTGINYTLPAFLKPDGTTKIVSIWDQTIPSENAYPFDTFFGTEYQSEQINQALNSADPFEIVPSTDENGHGTMLAAVAAGSENRDENFFGVAPNAELVVVKLRQAKQYLRDFYTIPQDVVCYQENSIMWAVQYCVLKARQLRRPISICIGIGSSQGPHDGTTPLNVMLSRRADVPNIGITTAAGNEGNRGRHFHAVIDPSVGSTTVELNVGENEGGFFMELWGDAPGIYSVDILSPSGEYIPRIPAGLEVRRNITFIFDQTELDVIYQTVESQTGDQLIRFIFHNVSAGTWKFNVYLQGNLPGAFNIWLPMGDFATDGTYFIKPDIYNTVLSPGTAIIPLTVTAYNPVNGTLYVNASRGYTRANTIKPELAAPGVNYRAPNIEGGYTNYTGTGVASAHTAGIVALGLEWGAVRGNDPALDTHLIKKYLIRGAKRSRNLIYPNRDWGYGILDIFNSFDVLRLRR